ncbi:hypothetical protein WG66_005743 [Moniliophthora roreri]|uniref:Uncharacterized protein n=1 Tax=Moniliophthora roreri TaxID=221103 RepID=A0A0W0GCJ8_MONRR|nr:hypothetical protein WG66_005743 [Moniliophthora roreri]
MVAPKISAAVALLLDLPILSLAYSWNFKQNPKQCGDLTIEITGNDGKPPYRVLIIPSGPTPLPNSVEARRILEQQFPSDSATSVTFQLKYPANSQFVAVVSDQNGFGSGGTSAAAQVTSSDDTSCFDSSQPVQPPFFFNIDPPNVIAQCQSTRLWWDPNKVQGDLNFVGVIPGGQSFQIPTGTLSNQTSTGTGFNWTPNVREGTTLHIVCGDGRGMGSGGSLRTTVGNNIQNDNSCLSNTSPSSTAGSPAGGMYPTDSSGNQSSGGSNGGGGNNTGAIVGGVIGGVFAILAAILILFFFRKRSHGNRSGEKPVDLLNADEGDESNRRQELPQYYEPEPFLVPDPTVAGSDGVSSDGRPLSMYTTDRSGTPDAASTSATRKTAPRQFRAVNIIQHDDAGPSEQKPAGEEEPETIELPPAYTNIRQ